MKKVMTSIFVCLGIVLLLGTILIGCGNKEEAPKTEEHVAEPAAEKAAEPAAEAAPAEAAPAEAPAAPEGH